MGDRWLYLGPSGPFLFGVIMITELTQQFTAWLNIVSGGNDMLSSAIFIFLVTIGSYTGRTIYRLTVSRLSRMLFATIVIERHTCPKTFTSAEHMLSGMDKVKLPVIKYKHRTKWGLVKLAGSSTYLAKVKGKLVLIKVEHPNLTDPKVNPCELDSIYTLTALRSSLGAIEESLERAIDYHYGSSNCKPTLAVRTVDPLSSSWKIARVDLPAKPLISSSIENDLVNPLEKIISGDNSLTHYGLSQKFSALLHGEPGTGKTSLIRWLAGHLNIPLFVVSGNSITDDKFKGVSGAITDDGWCLLLLEDFDTLQPEANGSVQSGKSIRYSTILNYLDGVLELNKVIVIMTTNSISEINPAVYRKGRMDRVLELPKHNAVDFIGYLEERTGEQYNGNFDITISGSDIDTILRYIAVDGLSLTESVQLATTSTDPEQTINVTDTRIIERQVKAEMDLW